MSTQRRQVITVLVKSASDSMILLIVIGPKKIYCELGSNKLIFQHCKQQAMNNTDLQSMESFSITSEFDYCKILDKPWDKCVVG